MSALFGGGDADFTANHWHALHAAFYEESGGAEVMTKVGAYAVIRFSTLVFPPDSAAIGSLVTDLLTPAALATLALGAIGVLGTHSLPRQVAFAAIGSMGLLFLAVAAGTPAAACGGSGSLVAGRPAAGDGSAQRRAGDGGGLATGRVALRLAGGIHAAAGGGASRRPGHGRPAAGVCLAA